MPGLGSGINDIAAIERPGKNTPQSIYVFSNRRGQAVHRTGLQGHVGENYGAMAKGRKRGGEVRERFTFHDLRAYYVTHMVEAERNPETHANPATTRRVYDRRRVVKVQPLE